MGLRQHIAAGAKLDRVTQTFVTNANGSGSITISPAAALLRIQANSTCRLRLYDTQTSLNTVAEISRSYADRNISASVALVADFTMSANVVNFIDPVLYSVPESTVGTLYYRINPPGVATVNLTYYELDDAAIVPTIGTSYTVDNRRPMTITENLSGTTAPVSGTLELATVPKTYLLVSASLNDPSYNVRVRLYRISDTLNDSTELNRPFSTEPSSSAQLIVDMILTGSNPVYFTPKIIGANLENMGTNLSAIRGNRTQFAGEAELYYVLQNLTVTPVTASVNLHLFALED
jgi:hypothetical protein